MAGQEGVEGEEAEAEAGEREEAAECGVPVDVEEVLLVEPLQLPRLEPHDPDPGAGAKEEGRGDEVRRT